MPPATGSHGNGVHHGSDELGNAASNGPTSQPLGSLTAEQKCLRMKFAILRVPFDNPTQIAFEVFTDAGLRSAAFLRFGVEPTANDERGEHHITPSKLETILGCLKIKLKDIFPEEY